MPHFALLRRNFIPFVRVSEILLTPCKTPLYNFSYKGRFPLFFASSRGIQRPQELRELLAGGEAAGAAAGGASDVVDVELVVVVGNIE